MSQGHILVQGATVKCNFSVAPQTDVLLVKSHTKHYANDTEGEEKLIATTKETGQTLEKNTFGKCKQQPLGNGDYKPCQAEITAWTTFYENKQLSNGGKVLTEQSKAGCPIGGPDCIEVIDHGQINEISQQNIDNADLQLTQQLCPWVNFKSVNEPVSFTTTIKSD